MSDPEYRGTLAKAVMALAKEGGGHIEIGRDGCSPLLETISVPAGLTAYDRGDVDNAVREFTETRIRLTPVNTADPAAGVTHPVVVVSPPT